MYLNVAESNKQTFDITLFLFKKSAFLFGVALNKHILALHEEVLSIVA